MDHNSFEVVQDESIFSLATLKSRAHLDQPNNDRVGFEAVEDDGIGDPDHDDALSCIGASDHPVNMPTKMSLMMLTASPRKWRACWTSRTRHI